MATLTEKVIIKIDGDDYKDYNFLNISLSQELLKPNVLRFTIQKKALKECMKDSDFPLPKKLMGAEVSLKIETQHFSKTDELEKSTQSLDFKGIIFNLNVYRRSDMFSEQLIDVVAYSHDYLLIDHPHCFSYENDNLKKIVAATLDPYNIPNNINPRTTDPIPYTVQYNESNYEFLIRLAKRYGEWMYNDGTKWIFGEIVQKDEIKLDARNDIQNYSYQTDLMHHKLKHAHHNYLKYENPIKSNSDISDLTSSGYHTLTDEAKKKSDKWFKKETFQHLRCSNPEVNDIDEPDVSIKAQLYGEKTQQVVCTGSTVRSDLTIGSVIDIYDYFFEDDKTHKDVQHDKLMITGITHYTEVNGHYSNFFTAVSANSKYPPYFQSDLYPVSSAQRAVVMDNQDPEKLGRIRVQFLWQKEQDENLMTPWIRIAQPHGGGDKGFYFIPEIDEEVMVDFENGNAEKPYVAGTLYHGEKQRPDEEWYSDSNDIKSIRTRNGHTVEIHDVGDDGYIRIYDYKKENYILTFSTDNKLIKMESTGNIELFAKGDILMEAEGTIFSKAGKDFGVDAGGQAHITSGDDSTYQSKANMSIYAKSNQDITVEGNVTEKVTGSLKHDSKEITMTSETGVKIKATSTMKLESTTHEQKASASMTLDGGGQLTAKAGMVKIN